MIQEGFDTLCAAPLLDGDDRSLGLLGVYHDRPHPWTEDELETIGAFAAQAASRSRPPRTTPRWPPGPPSSSRSSSSAPG